MRNLLKKENRKLLLFLTFISSVILFSPSIGNFFSSDDWFHLRVSQVSGWGEFLNFFSFSRTPQFAGSYRPLSTQVFFFIFQSLFGLNPVPYHVFILAVFGFNLYLVYRLAKELLGGDKRAFLAVLFYGISVTNFTRVYFISAFQEISLVFFILLSILFHLRSSWAKYQRLSLLFFVLALMSKETAIVLPAILLLIDWSRKKVNPVRLFPFFGVLAVYIYLRFFHLGGVSGESYIWDFSPKKALNTLSWYTLWSFGAPEFLVDYVSSGLRVLPRFYQDFPAWSYVVLSLTAATVGSFLVATVRNIQLMGKRTILFAGIFVIALGPVLFLPWHKFALELGVPLVGFSLLLASLYRRKLAKTFCIFAMLFVILNLVSNGLTYKTHYSVNRGKVAGKVADFFVKNYPQGPAGKYFEFINDTSDYGSAWGSSKQVAQATAGSEMFRVLYKNPRMEVYFQDFPGERPMGRGRVEISSKLFLGVN